MLSCHCDFRGCRVIESATQGYLGNPQLISTDSTNRSAPSGGRMSEAFNEEAAEVLRAAAKEAEERIRKRFLEKRKVQ